MLFEVIEIGEIGIDDQICVLVNVVSVFFFGLGLCLGDIICVEDVIMVFVVKSVNDVVVVVGECIGGGEVVFVSEMIECVCVLGLDNIIFCNVFGLFNFCQIMIVQDMVCFVIVLYWDFFQYFDYFDWIEFIYCGCIYCNYNFLVGWVEGVDGLKIGYIWVLGFNVVVFVECGENWLIVVIMGGLIVVVWDVYVEELLEVVFNMFEQCQDSCLFVGLIIFCFNLVCE